MDIASGLTAEYIAEADIAKEYKFLVAMIPLINTGEDHIGWMKSETWASMIDNRRRLGLLTKPLEPSDVFTLRFQSEVYGPLP